MITGINVVRNCIETGYPWVESILSAYPLCDEYYVNDGGSTDGTLETLYKLKETYPRIQIFNISDEENVRWDSVSNQINTMIEDANGDTIFLGNADELIHENDIHYIKEYINETKHRILRFDRREIRSDWSNLSKEVYHPARIAKNIKGIRQDWNNYGGDEFLYDDGWPDPNREWRMGVVLYHLYNMFPLNRVAKLRNDAEYLAPGDETRVSQYQRMKDAKLTHVTPKNIYGGLPALARGLPYMGKYYVRECLFDEKWVEGVTGLHYS